MHHERIDGWKAGRLEGLRDGQTDNAEVICPLNFFEVGRGRVGGRRSCEELSLKNHITENTDFFNNDLNSISAKK